MLEHDVELYLWDHPDRLGVDRWLTRQMRFPSGAIDLLGVDRDENWVLVEVKYARKDDSGLLQLYRYLSDARDIQRRMYGEGAPGLRGVLVTRNSPTDMLRKDAAHLGVKIYQYSEYSASVSLLELDNLPVSHHIDSEKRLQDCAAKLWAIANAPKEGVNYVCVH
jgi:RecB family endonuclease NucS